MSPTFKLVRQTSTGSALPMKDSLRAVVFDFDGLVVDTESIGYFTWKEIFSAHGADLPVARYAQLVGTSFETGYDPRHDLEECTGRSFDWPRIEAERREREHSLGLSLSPLPGVLERLAEARALGLRTAVASSSNRTWIDMWIERFNLGDHFDHISTVDDTGKVKPDPSIFFHASEALGMHANEIVIFEDSQNGLTAARAAGIRCIVAPSPMTSHLEFEGAWKQVRSLEEVSLRKMIHDW